MYFWSTTAIKELDFHCHCLGPCPYSLQLNYFTFDDSSLTFLYLIFHITVTCLSKYKYGYFTILFTTPQWFPTFYKRKENYFEWHLKFFMTWFCFYLQPHCFLLLIVHPSLYLTLLHKKMKVHEIDFVLNLLLIWTCVYLYYYTWKKSPFSPFVPSILPFI